MIGLCFVIRQIDDSDITHSVNYRQGLIKMKEGGARERRKIKRKKREEGKGERGRGGR